MRILLVEDDPAQLEPLYVALSRCGNIVDAVEEGTTARWLMGEKTYDLLILDWMLGEDDGVVLCQEFRHNGISSPILILTAKDTTEDLVMGLDAGADDYLVKPVDITELLARIRALRRRSPLWRSDQVKVKVQGDETLLRSAIENLLSNACRYTNPGGRISLALQLHEEQISIHVTDTGIGIPETGLDHIFECFYRGHHSYQKTQGFGLGRSDRATYYSSSRRQNHRHQRDRTRFYFLDFSPPNL